MEIYLAFILLTGSVTLPVLEIVNVLELAKKGKNVPRNKISVYLAKRDAIYWKWNFSWCLLGLFFFCIYESLRESVTQIWERFCLPWLQSIERLVEDIYKQSHSLYNSNNYRLPPVGT